MANTLVKYKQIEDDILEDIRSGKLVPGDKIEAESALKKKYGVSTITVRKAFNDLINAGYLYGVQGLGTYVSKAHLQRDAESLDLYRDMKSKGLKPSIKVVSIKEVHDEGIRKKLETSKDKKIYCISRVRYGDDFPIAFHKSYVSRLSIDKLEEFKNYESFYEFLNKYNLEPEWVRESYSATTLDDNEVCEYLNIEKGSAAFLAKRIAYDSYDKPIEYCESYFEKDHYSVTMTIKNIR